MEATMLDSFKLITVHAEILVFLKKKLVVALLEIYHMYNSQFNMVICIGQKSLSCACIM